MGAAAVTHASHQIVEKDATTIKAELGSKNKSPATTLVEIGPRFVLTPIRMFEGSFGGPTVFSNPGAHTSYQMLDSSNAIYRIPATNQDTQNGEREEG